MGCALLMALPFVLSGVMILRKVHALFNLHARSPDSEITLAVSPDGREIVFTGAGEEQRDLYLWNLKTSQVTALTHTESLKTYPSFSPDGKWIVYAAGKPGERADHIVLQSLDGRHVQQLTSEADANDACPVFLSNGKQILFLRSKVYITGGMVQWGSWRGTQVYVMGTDGKSVHPISQTYNSLERLSYSQTSGRGVLTAGYGYDACAIPFRTEGAQPAVKVITQLSNNDPIGAAISPDGKQIAYVTQDNAKYDLIRVDSAGLHPHVILEHANASNPIFTPDGKRCYFYADYANRKCGLWQVDIDGKNLRQLADNQLFMDPLGWHKPH